MFKGRILKILITVNLIILIAVCLTVLKRPILSLEADLSITQSYIEKCQNLASDQLSQQCWDNSLDQILGSYGLDEAFNFLTSLYSANPVFAADCHSYAHKLGEQAYRLFSKNETINFSEKSSYCGYGFYHGFMELLLHTTGDMNQARTFCELADKSLRKTTSDAGGACIHGIGHGAVDDVPDPKLWGKPQEIIDGPISLCEEVFNDSQDLFRCTTGVYNALEILMSSEKYGLTINKADPMWICDSQKEKYRLPCYTQMVIALMNATNNDFQKAAEFITSIKEDEFALPALQSLMVEQVRLNRIGFEETVKLCRNLGSRFNLTCIYSFGEGFLKYGPPETEYVKALEFCNYSGLTSAEKTACFKRILPILRIWYSAEKSQQICLSVEEKYRPDKNCHYQ